MVTAIIGVACTAAGFIVAYIICRRIQKSDDDQAQTFDIPPLTPNKWRIRKKDGAWLVHRRTWHRSYPIEKDPYWVDMHTKYVDRYRFAAPTWEIAFDYCQRRGRKEGK